MWPPFLSHQCGPGDVNRELRQHLKERRLARDNISGVEAGSAPVLHNCQRGTEYDLIVDVSFNDFFSHVIID